ncbi:nitroreductase family deazaflavin-dependent oxidoreductase [Sciscionella sediminilitoris]|uniref:nitroreductase family deazaflavin-dependent oxidoreductase n=1 Tax=Sciscionella sediminilitoris TaxID=1445613 RepID=UPI0004DF0B32|nr:nitroreductase family deazaflavin-dependent oxidoreductase [Sciscionella sp. SE31]
MADLYLAVLRTHQRIYEKTGGALGHRLLGMPTLLLRTLGRRSGKARTSALVYAREGDAYLVVASNGGARKAPAWLHNLRAEPECEIQIGRRRKPARAEIVSRDDDRYPALLAKCDAVNRDRYSAYQRRTERPIPVVVLTPHR